MVGQKDDLTFYRTSDKLVITVNASEAIKYLSEGGCVTFNVPNAFTYYRMYAGDVILRLMPDCPVAATVNTIQTKEQFLSQYSDAGTCFKPYNP